MYICDHESRTGNRDFIIDTRSQQTPRSRVLFPRLIDAERTSPHALGAFPQVREEHSRKDILAPEAITQRGGNCSLCAWMAAHHSLAAREKAPQNKLLQIPWRNATRGRDGGRRRRSGRTRSFARKTLCCEKRPAKWALIVKYST